MSADLGPTQPVEAPGAARETFELERFAWGGPDRLELSGKFAGLRERPADAPVLVVSGAQRVHRLPAVPESWTGPPEDGREWQAAFAWQEAPEPFETAQLELGAGLVVVLPEPGAKRPRFRHQLLEVRRPAAEAAPAPEPAAAPAPQAAAAPAPQAAAAPAPQPVAHAMPDAGAERLRLEADLLTAQQRIRELGAQAAEAREEVANAQRALAAERERHAADAERFRDGIAQVRGSAEEAMAAESAAVVRLTGEVEAARGESAALRSRIAELEREVADLEREVADLERRREASAAGLAAAREGADATRADVEQLLARLETLRGALGERD